MFCIKYFCFLAGSIFFLTKLRYYAIFADNYTSNIIKVFFMRRINVDRLKPDMIVAKTIIDSDGRVLLHAGMSLTSKYISRLADLGILSIYIRDGFLDDEEYITDVISEKTRVETVREVKNNFKNLEKNSSLNVFSIKKVVNNIIDELLANNDILVQLADIRSFDDYTFGHSVNVCILSIITGITMGYNELKLKELGIGALLHDIGKTKIDKDILNKPDDLTPEEFEEIKRHTVYGFDILRHYEDISLLSAHIAYQHHERWDGLGYPRGLAGMDIHEFGRIAAAADVYDALLADRPYRPAYNVNQALTILSRMSGTYLDKDCVIALKANIAIYPVGSFVQLTTGDIGIIMNASKSNPTRPKIKVVFDSNKHIIANPREIDLARLSTVMISRPLREDEVPLE